MPERTKRGFTIVELVLVLALLAVLSGLLVPRLAAFFQGRSLDDEARRLWSLTRYARQLAVTRTVPVAVWVSNTEARYGIEFLPGYGPGSSADPMAFPLPEELEVIPSPSSRDQDEPLTMTWWPDGSIEADAEAWVLRRTRAPEDAWTLARKGNTGYLALQRGGQDR